MIALTALLSSAMMPDLSTGSDGERSAAGGVRGRVAVDVVRSALLRDVRDRHFERRDESRSPLALRVSTTTTTPYTTRMEGVSSTKVAHGVRLIALPRLYPPRRHPGLPIYGRSSGQQPQRIPFCSNQGAHHVSGAQEDRLPLSAARTPHRIMYDPTHCRAASSRVCSRGDIFEPAPYCLYRMSPSGAREGVQGAECRLRVMGGEKRPKIWHPLRVDC